MTISKTLSLISFCWLVRSCSGMQDHYQQIQAILHADIGSIECKNFIERYNQVNISQSIQGTIFEPLAQVEKEAHSYQNPLMIKLRYLLMQKFGFCIATYAANDEDKPLIKNALDYISVTEKSPIDHCSTSLVIKDSRFGFELTTAIGNNIPVSIQERFTENEKSELPLNKITSEHLDLDDYYKATYNADGDDYSISIINNCVNKCIRKLVGHKNNIYKVKKLDNFCIASLTKDGIIKIWNLDPWLDPLEIILINKIIEMKGDNTNASGLNWNEIKNNLHDDWKQIFEKIITKNNQFLINILC